MLEHENMDIALLRKDIREAAENLGKQEARFLVDTYYALQKFRIQLNNQIKAVDEADEPVSVLQSIATNQRQLEDAIKSALDRYSATDEIGKWCRDVTGVGPVIAAGLIAHLDIEQAPTAGHFFAFGGLDPTAIWAKGKKRPWNADLKVIYWKLGESFVITKSAKGAFYGPLYEQRKVYETAKNEAGDYADQAATMLVMKKFRKETEAYKAYSKGKLPPAHIHRRAARWATKIFISNLHGFWFQKHYGKPAPSPYPLAHLGHAHLISHD